MDPGTELRAIDRALADEICAHFPPPAAACRAAAAQVSRMVADGHSCYPIQTDDPLLKLLGSWAAVGSGEASRPLVLDAQGRLYLRRYWRYEEQLAQRLLELAEQPIAAHDSGRMRLAFESLFPGDRDDAQAIAAASGCCGALTIILGGPGTGKTWTVLRLLALAVLASPAPPRIALAAPTGKAAARVSDAIASQRDRLGLDTELLQRLPRQATTLHRLLGMPRHSVIPRFDRLNPLPFDLVLVDEASMIDLPLMSRLLCAMAPGARLVLLGDPDQLASVEAGAVLAQLRSAAGGGGLTSTRRAMVAAVGADPHDLPDAGTAIAGSMITLRRPRRFGTGDRLANVLDAVRAGDQDLVVKLLNDAGREVWREGPAAGPKFADVAPWVEYFAVDGHDPEAAVAGIARCRILCAPHAGPSGVRAWNRALRETLAQDGAGPDFVHGEPILITRNSATLGLTNGDLGIALHAPDHGWRVWMRASDGILRSFSGGELPSHESAFAMTVHKAQGSEFERLLVVLPPADHPLLTRQWLYTALSRSRGQFTVLGTEAALRQAIGNPARRYSGLGDRIMPSTP